MNVLIVGIGHHSRRIYLPHLSEMHKRGIIQGLYTLDLTGEEDRVTKVLEGYEHTGAYFLDAKNKSNTDYVTDYISELIKMHSISGVIIATEPIFHYLYEKIFLNFGVHILVDKPITLYNDMLNDVTLSDRLVHDYEELISGYKKKKKDNPNYTFEIMCQRRYHRAYKKLASYISEVFAITNCPVTYINTFHCDGQRRFPEEIILQDYHPYNEGYGKLGHSGYHAIDMACYLAGLTQSETKHIDKVSVSSFCTTTQDLLYQFNIQDYKKLFHDFEKYHPRSQKDYDASFKGFGDVDVGSIIKLQSQGSTQCIISSNILHNGFGQRHRVNTHGKDLYKGNGRVRQEFFMIEQGPFQSIFLESFQAHEINKKESALFEPGGEYHLEIHVYRNSALIPEWDTYEHISVENLYDGFGSGYIRGQNEEARREGIDQFIAKCKGERSENGSDLLSHHISLHTFAAIFKSLAMQRAGQEDTLISYNL